MKHKGGYDCSLYTTFIKENLLYSIDKKNYNLNGRLSTFRNNLNSAAIEQVSDVAVAPAEPEFSIISSIVETNTTYTPILYDFPLWTPKSYGVGAKVKYIVDYFNCIAPNNEIPPTGFNGDFGVTSAYYWQQLPNFTESFVIQLKIRWKCNPPSDVTLQVGTVANVLTGEYYNPDTETWEYTYGDVFTANINTVILSGTNEYIYNNYNAEIGTIVKIINNTSSEVIQSVILY